MSGSKRGWHQWTEYRWQQFQLGNKDGFNKFVGDRDPSPPWVLDTDWSPSPPWVLMAACDLASFAHRLLLRQEYRDKHYIARKTHERHNKVLVYGWHMGALAKGGHPLSTVDRLKFYLNGPPY